MIFITIMIRIIIHSYTTVTENSPTLLDTAGLLLPKIFLAVTVTVTLSLLNRGTGGWHLLSVVLSCSSWWHTPLLQSFPFTTQVVMEVPEILV